MLCLQIEKKEKEEIARRHKKKDLRNREVWKCQMEKKDGKKYSQCKKSDENSTDAMSFI